MHGQIEQLSEENRNSKRQHEELLGGMEQLHEKLAAVEADKATSQQAAQEKLCRLGQLEGAISTINSPRKARSGVCHALI